MARLTDTILGNKAYGRDTESPMVDLRNGGQQGSATDLTSYVSNSSYVKRNLIALLIEAPRGFDDLENGDLYKSTLKALVELHPKSIEGLQQSLTVDHAENAVGGGGEMQEDFTNVTRTRSTPTFVWNEKYGKPVTYFLRNWITGLIMDPITKYPTVVSKGLRSLQDLLPDYTGMTVLFFEPDPTHTKVLEAWLCTNMRPKTTGDITGRRDLTQANETQDLSIEFTALTQVGLGVTQLAQRLLNSMNLTGLNPNLQNAFVREISADVRAADRGYAEGLANQASTQVG